MSWTDVRDQTGATRVLARAIAAPAIAPAYLFSGPAGVGKAFTARVFAQALNCEAGTGDACGTCLSCRTIASGNHPDLLWARPEKRSRTITVDAARACIRALALAPQIGRHRVAVFDDADCLNPTAQNVLLKTLEEPAARSLIVLVSAVPDALLPTVRSRCQVVRFGPLPPVTVADLLERDGVPAEAARRAAAASGGSVAQARMFADAGRLDFMYARIAQAIAGDPAGAAAEHARDLGEQEKRLEKSSVDTEVNPDLLSREQLARLAQEREARVRREMTERVEGDVRLIALSLRDGIAGRAAGDPAVYTLGPPPPEFEQAPPEHLAIALDHVDRGLTYLRQFIRRDRVLFHVYTAVAEAARPAA